MMVTVDSGARGDLATSGSSVDEGQSQTQAEVAVAWQVEEQPVEMISEVISETITPSSTRDDGDGIHQEEDIGANTSTSTEVGITPEKTVSTEKKEEE